MSDSSFTRFLWEEAEKTEADELAEQIIQASGGDPKRTREAGNLILNFVNQVMRRRGIEIFQARRG